MTRTLFSRRSVVAGTLALSAAPALANSGELIEPIMRLSRRSRIELNVALTFDACPGAFDERIATCLVREAVPATIMVSGAWMRRNPRGLAYLLAHPEVFTLENHGEWHIPPILGPGRIFGLACAGDIETVRREVSRGAADIETVTGARPTWYRAAAGFYSPAALQAIRDMGVAIAGYSLNGDIGASLTASNVADRIAGAVDGDVIVAHINQPHRPSGQGVVEGILALRARGARFRRLARLGVGDVSYSR